MSHFRDAGSGPLFSLALKDPPEPHTRSTALSEARHVHGPYCLVFLGQGVAGRGGGGGGLHPSTAGGEPIACPLGACPPTAAVPPDVRIQAWNALFQARWPCALHVL